MKTLTFFSLLCSGITALQGNSLFPNIQARYVEEPDFRRRPPEIGQTYSSHTGNTPYLSTFGDATRTSSGRVKNEKKCVRAGFWTWDKSYEQFPTKAYAVYKYEYRANSGTNLIDESIVYIGAGLDYSLQVRIAKGTVNTYSTSITETVATKLSMTESVQAKGNIYGVDVKGSVSSTQEITNEISASITETASYTYQTEVISTYSLHANESKYYRLEQRATFDVYCIQSYNIEYTKETNVTYDNGYRNARYTYTPHYVLEQQIVKFVYVKNSETKGFYKYKSDGYGAFEYDDVKENNIVYF